ncbi:MAG: zinc-binding dehydrogenase [Actinomycetota bacterium]|nr:zinc-binding dehydrogenase [Actinomycetota bacterium]
MSQGLTRIAVAAAPLNPLDLLIASGTFHSARHELPYVPGSECVGQVVDSDCFALGSWVYAEFSATPSSPGPFADEAVALNASVLQLPADVNPVQAAAVGNSGTAAFMPLVDHAAMRPGETVIVLGATGVVGQLAVQIARLRGAGAVIAVGRDRSVLERLPDLGADAVVELRTDESAGDLADRLLGVAGPANVVLDGIYGLPFEAALLACAPHARLVNVGNLAGPTSQVPAGLLRGKQLTITGFAGLHTPLADKERALTWLWRALADDKLQIGITTWPLEHLPMAWSAQAASPHNKYVVLPQELSRS